MREILFRGKRVDDGQWVYGYFYKIDMGKVMISTCIKREAYEVQPETVGHFTGLSDCINNAIFDGDLVRAFDGKECEFDKSFIGIVKFIDGAFGVEWHFIDF